MRYVSLLGTRSDFRVLGGVYDASIMNLPSSEDRCIQWWRWLVYGYWMFRLVT